MHTSGRLSHDYSGNTTYTHAQMIVNHVYSLTLHEIRLVSFTSDQQIPKVSKNNSQNNEKNTKLQTADTLSQDYSCKTTETHAQMIANHYSNLTLHETRLVSFTSDQRPADSKSL